MILRYLLIDGYDASWIVFAPFPKQGAHSGGVVHKQQSRTSQINHEFEV